MTVQRIFVDANVLASRVQRDWLFLIAAETRMFDTYITEDVLAETIRVHRKRRPTAGGGEITRLRAHLVQAADHMVDDFPGALTFVGTDQHDRHVHAAAVACDAHKLLTCDNGFLRMDESLMDALPYEPWRPDDFFILANDSAHAAVRAVVQDQLRYWKAGVDKPQLAEKLADDQCPMFAEAVREHLAALTGPAALKAYKKRKEAAARSKARA